MANLYEIEDAILESLLFQLGQRGMSTSPGSTNKALMEVIAHAVATAMANDKFRDPATLAKDWNGHAPGHPALDANEIYYRTCQDHGGRTINEAIRGMLQLLCDAINQRLQPLTDALALVGNQVNEHNTVIRTIAPPPEDAGPQVWECYCGMWNAIGRACRVCDRKSP